MPVAGGLQLLLKTHGWEKQDPVTEQWLQSVTTPHCKDIRGNSAILMRLNLEDLDAEWLAAFVAGPTWAPAPKESASQQLRLAWKVAGGESLLVYADKPKTSTKMVVKDHVLDLAALAKEGKLLIPAGKLRGLDARAAYLEPFQRKGAGMANFVIERPGGHSEITNAFEDVKAEYMRMLGKKGLDDTLA